MNREFLKDYEQKEINKQHRIFSDLKSGHYNNLKAAYLETQNHVDIAKSNDILINHNW